MSCKTASGGRVIHSTSNTSPPQLATGETTLLSPLPPSPLALADIPARLTRGHPGRVRGLVSARGHPGPLGALCPPGRPWLTWYGVRLDVVAPELTLCASTSSRSSRGRVRFPPPPGSLRLDIPRHLVASDALGRPSPGA